MKEHGFLKSNNMKRKIFYIVISCVMSYIGITGINLNLNRNENKMDMSFLNVEALASGESDHTTVDCPSGSTLCATVNAPTGTWKYYKQ
jgi:hypothetical protein